MARPGAGRRQPGGVTKSFTSNLPSVEDVLKRTSEINGNEDIETNNSEINDKLETLENNTQSTELDPTTNENTSNTYKKSPTEVVIDKETYSTNKKELDTNIILEEEHNSLSRLSEELDSMDFEDPFANLTYKELLANKEVVYLDTYSLEHADLETYYNHSRPYTEKEMAKLMCSIIREGVIYPLIVYKEKSGRLIVISGNHRLIAVLRIIQLYSEAEWFDENRYTTIKCIVLEEEDANGNCTSLDEARRIVLETNIRRENTSEEELAATLHYEKEILLRETAHLSRYPILQALAVKVGRPKTSVYYILQIYENLIPELHTLYYKKNLFKKEHAILLSKLSPEVQKWIYDTYYNKKRIIPKYLSRINQKTINELIDIKDTEGIKACIDLALGSNSPKKETLVEVKQKIPQNMKEFAKKTLDEIATASSKLTQGNTLMAMMCEVPENLVSEDIRNRCLEAMLNIINEAKETGI